MADSFQPDKPVKDSFVTDSFQPESNTQELTGLKAFLAGPKGSLLRGYAEKGMAGVKEAVDSQNKYAEEHGGVVAGSPPMVAPENQLPSAISKTAAYLSSSPAKRIATGTAVGAALSPEDRLGGAAKGFGASALGETGLGLLKAYRGAKTVASLADNPAALKQTSADALNSSRSALIKTSEDTIQPALQGKTTQIRPAVVASLGPQAEVQLQPYVDQFLPEGWRGTPYSQLPPFLSREVPQLIEVPATTTHEIRKMGDEILYGNKSTPSVGGNAPQNPEAVKAATEEFRDSLHNLGPDTQKAYSTASTNLNLARNIRTNSPVSKISSQAPDNIATLSQAEDVTGVPLTGMGKVAKAANEYRTGNVYQQTKALSKGALGGLFSGEGPSNVLKPVSTPKIDRLFPAVEGAQRIPASYGPGKKKNED